MISFYINVYLINHLNHSIIIHKKKPNDNFVIFIRLFDRLIHNQIFLIVSYY